MASIKKGGITLLLLLVILLFAVAVSYGTHAVDTHGSDAVIAREKIRGCSPENFGMAISPKLLQGFQLCWEPETSKVYIQFYSTDKAFEITSFIGKDLKYIARMIIRDGYTKGSIPSTLWSKLIKYYPELSGYMIP